MLLATFYTHPTCVTIFTVLITLAVLPATLDVLVPISGSLSHILDSPILFVLGACR